MFGLFCRATTAILQQSEIITILHQSSSAAFSNSQTYHWTIENLLTYDRTFGKHGLMVALFL